MVKLLQKDQDVQGDDLKMQDKKSMKGQFDHGSITSKRSGCIKR